MKVLPVLMYHHVSPNPGLVTLSPEIFREQIAALAAAGWRSIGSKDLEDFLAGQPLPAKSVLISFDDGYVDNFIHAHPVLREFGMTALLFIVTGWIGDGSLRTAADCPDHRECKRRIADNPAITSLGHCTDEDMDRLYQASRFGRPSTRILYEEQRINLFAECVKSAESQARVDAR